MLSVSEDWTGQLLL